MTSTWILKTRSSRSLSVRPDAENQQHFEGLPDLRKSRRVNYILTVFSVIMYLQKTEGLQWFSKPMPFIPIGLSLITGLFP